VSSCVLGEEKTVNRVLLVDDDHHTLSAYRRLLRKKFDLVTVSRAAEGIAVLKERGPFAVVVSDFRMPEMDGIQFLSLARQEAPDTVRIMLTGQADIQAAIDAINEGSIFRFLTKPCPSEDFIKTLAAAVEQYRLVMAERELIEKTLKGSIKLLTDMLSIINPVAFRQSSRLREMARKVAARLKIDNLWEVELAAMLSQIGCVTVPGEVLEKRYRGEALFDSEQEMFLAHPQVGRKLLSNIPRLERIAEAIAYQLKLFNGQGPPYDSKRGNSIPLLARIIKIVLDYDALMQAGMKEVQALETMCTREGWYDPYILDALKKEVESTLDAEVASTGEEWVVKSIPVKDIMAGMVLADDLRDNRGVMLIAKGYEITEVVKMRLLNFARLGAVVDPVKVLVRVKKN